MHKKNISSVIILLLILLQPLSLSGPSIITLNQTEAQSTLGSAAGEYGKCAAMNALIDKAKQAAMDYLKKLGGKMKGGKIGQAIGGLGGGGQSVPISSTTIEGNTEDTKKNTKAAETKAEEAIRLQRKQECFRKVARKVLVKMTEKTINWALTGFKGEPFYVKDQGSFLNSIKDEVTIKKIEELKKCASGNCPYGKDTAKSLITIEKNKLLNEATQFTLNKVNPNWREFTKGGIDSFSKGGGWNTFFAYTQNEKNNPLGSFISTSLELNNKKAEEVGKIQTELAQNQGFLSLKKCVKTAASGVGSNISTSGGLDNIFDSFGNNINGTGQSALNCLKYEVISPGGVIREQLFKALNLPVEQKQAEANQGTDNIAQFADVALDLIGKGLNKLVTSNSGSSISGSGGQGSNTSFLGTTTEFGNWAVEPTEFQFELENPTAPGTPGEDLLKAISYIEEEKGYLEQQVILLKSFRQKTKTLDECLPGPDINWRNQLVAEYTTKTAAVRAVAEGSGGAFSATIARARAQTALQRLDALYTTDINNITSSMSSVLLSTPIIQGQINKITEYNNSIVEIEFEIQKRKEVLIKLNLIKSKIASYPGTIINGVFTQNPLQNSQSLKNLFGTLLEYTIDDSGVQSAKQALEELQYEDEIAFDTTSGISILNLCQNERALLPDDTKARDQGQTLFCIWQTPINGGNTTNVFGDPIIPRRIGGPYAQDFDPFLVEAGSSIPGGIPTPPTPPGGGSSNMVTPPVMVQCSSFYRTPQSLYDNLVEILPNND